MPVATAEPTDHDHEAGRGAGRSLAVVISICRDLAMDDRWAPKGNLPGRCVGAPTWCASIPRYDSVTLEDIRRHWKSTSIYALILARATHGVPVLSG